MQEHESVVNNRKLLDATETHTHSDDETHTLSQTAATPAPAGSATCMLAPSEYCGSYIIDDETYGTMIEVEVTEDTREIMSNAIPPFETGEFPNPDNEYTVTAQNISVSLPLVPTFRGTAETVREVGISVLGIMFEPGNAQRAECEDGTSLNIEAFNNSLVGFGIDDNGAHVRDTTGLYHYHGPSTQEIEMPDASQDIVHVGFAFDGHMMYYSRSDAYTPGYVLSTEPRAGGTCTYSEPDIPEFTLSTTPDGTILQDWVFTAGLSPTPPPVSGVHCA